MIDDAYTIEDAYASAQYAPNLRMDPEKRTPIDVLTAVAMSKNRLGSAIMRLHTEWDRVRAEFRKTPADVNNVFQAVNQRSKGQSVVKSISTAASFHESRMTEIAQHLNTWGLVERSLVHRCQVTGVESAHSVARHAMFEFLHPHCDYCNGTGKHNEDDCKHCGGSGSRDKPQDVNVLAILDWMAACVGQAQDDARRYLHGS